MHIVPRASPSRLACWVFLVLFPLAFACTSSLAPDEFKPAGKATIEMFSEAEAYERFMGRWSRSLVPPFLKFAGLKDGDRVLDVGSGTGSLAFTVVQEAPASQVVGVDSSRTYVDYSRAQGRTTSASHSRRAMPSGSGSRTVRSTGPSPCSLSTSSRTGLPRCTRWLA